MFTLTLVAPPDCWLALCRRFRLPAKVCFRDCTIPRERWAAEPRGRGCARRCYSGNRPYGCPVDLGRAAFQEFPASTHRRSRLPHRPRDYHEIRPARNPVRYARKGRSLPQALLERCDGCLVCAARVGFRSPGGPCLARVFSILERPAPSYSLQYGAMTLTADPQYFSVMQIPCCAAEYSPNTSGSATTTTSL